MHYALEKKNQNLMPKTNPHAKEIVCTYQRNILFVKKSRERGVSHATCQISLSIGVLQRTDRDGGRAEEIPNMENALLVPWALCLAPRPLTLFILPLTC